MSPTVPSHPVSGSLNLNEKARPLDFKGAGNPSVKATQEL